MIVKSRPRTDAGRSAETQNVRTRAERPGYRTVLVENQTEFFSKWVMRLVVLALIIAGIHYSH